MFKTNRFSYGFIMVCLISLLLVACKTSKKHKCKDCPKFSYFSIINQANQINYEKGNHSLYSDFNYRICFL